MSKTIHERLAEVQEKGAAILEAEKRGEDIDVEELNALKSEAVELKSKADSIEEANNSV